MMKRQSWPQVTQSHQPSWKLVDLAVGALAVREGHTRGLCSFKRSQRNHIQSIQLLHEFEGSQSG